MPASSSAAPASSSIAPTSIGAPAIAAQKGCDHYKLLEIILNKNNATGVLHHSSTQDPPNTDEENELDNHYHNNGSASHVHVDNDSSEDDLHEVEYITRSGKRQVQVRSKKEYTSHMMGEALPVWVKASLEKAKRYRDRSTEATSCVTSDCSLTKCVTVLDEMEDIPHDAYGKALEKFMNPDWIEVFIVMYVERKRG
ncbi:hypothetical protein KIW84_074041 [Lathyrus oleraceus]|uniref:Uncharacterized protein n=1 Tax=Pisum sativum TaxID=3888 RepID=A0A9D4ZZF0_PEA|nr:hypothetical protein KIW84_074041 [Pisum sativum]